MLSSLLHPTLFLQRLRESSGPVMARAKLLPGFLDTAYRVTLKTAVILAGLILVIATLKAAFGSHIVIEPLSVPRQLEEDGYSGAVVARRLMSEVQIIGKFGDDLYLTQSQDGLKERIRFRSEDDFSALATVHVPSSNLSLRSMAQALRDFLGFPERKISGEVTIRRSADGKTPTGYRILLRFGSPLSESTKPVEADTIDEAVHLAAPAIAEQFDPVGLASFYLRTNKWGEINRLEDKLISHADPDMKKQGWLVRGAHAFVQDRSDEAITCFQEALKQDPKLGEAYNSWGAALASQGDYDGAIEKYDKAIELAPFNFTAYMNRGFAYRGMSQPDRAIKDFEKSIKLNPNFALTYLNRGVVYLDIKQ